MPRYRTALTQSAREGHVFHGMWLMSDSADFARMSSSMGYDFVCIDMQHGYARASDVGRLIDAIRSGGGALVAARPTGNHFAEIGMLADAGVEAIFIPLVSSAEDARRAVTAIDYPDRGGTRSWGPTAALTLSDVPAAAALRPLLIVMVENRAGVESIEEIAAVDGVDGIYIGVKDLALSLSADPGSLRLDTEHAIARVLSVTRACRKIAAIGGPSEEIPSRREQGFTFLTAANDLLVARRAFAQTLAAATRDA